LHTGQALQSQAQIFALEKPSESQLGNVVNWINGVKPVAEVESHIFDKPADLASLGSQESSKEFLERYLEKSWYGYFSKR